MRVSIGEVTLFVDVDGAALVPEGNSMRERPTLVMLHGGPGLDHTPFKQPIFSPLKEVAQVVYYDHRGNGRSDRSSPDKWNLDTWADDVVALCSALGIEHPIVFGGSFGGFVALNYALRHPAHPAKLILSSTAAHVDVERSTGDVRTAGRVGSTSASAEAFLTNPSEETFPEYQRVCSPLYTQRPQPPEVFDRMIRHLEVMQHFRDSGEMFAFDYRTGLKSIRCPVLLMAGVLDPIVTIEDARELAAALPQASTTSESFRARDTCLRSKTPMP